MKKTTQDKLNEIMRKHEMWINAEEGGERADLQWANLRGADLRGANWDFSCFPLWCGGAHFKADLRLVYQLLAHICTLEVEGEEFAEIKEKILPYAMKSHRAEDLRLVEEGK